MIGLGLFAALTITGETAAVGGLVALVGFLGVKFLGQKDTEIETRRANAIKASQVLYAKGLKKLPAVLNKYGVGDYSGLAHDLKGLAEEVMDPARIGLEFDTLFDNMLAEKLKDSEALAALEKKVAQAKASAAVTAK